MEKKANKNTEKKEAALASVLEKIVWADRKKARTSLSKLAKDDLAKNVKGLVAMLRQDNDDATVKASFALEGLVMEAGNQEGCIPPEELGKALVKALPAAKDDYALCIVLEEIRRLGMVDGYIKELKPYLLRDDPVFTYALMALEALCENEGPLKISRLLLSAADECKDAARRKLIYGAILRAEGLNGSGGVQYDDAVFQKFQPGKLNCKAQADIMLLEEMALLISDLDYDLVKKALRSKSPLVRGLAQRVLYNAASMVFDDVNDSEDNAVSCLFEELLEDCVDFGGISLMSSLWKILANNPSWVNTVFPLSHALFQEGDAQYKMEIIKLIAGSEYTPYGVEHLVRLVTPLGDTAHNVQFKVGVLDILASRKDNCASAYAMTQLKSEYAPVRAAARRAALAMGVSDKLIDIMQKS